MSDTQTEAGAGTTATTTTTAAAAQAEQVVPYTQFASAIERRNRAESEAAALREQLAEAQTKLGTVTLLTGQVSDLTAKEQAARSALDTYRTIGARGILDPDVASETAKVYETLPKTARPPLGEWLDGFKADPTKIETLPTLLKPHLQAVFAPAKAAASTSTAGHRASAHQSSAGGTGGPNEVHALMQRHQRGEIDAKTFREQMAALRVRAPGT